MKHRSTFVGVGLAAACALLVAGCGLSEQEASGMTFEAPEAVVRPPAPARHALGAVNEARRLEKLVNARQASAMAELDR